MRDDLKLRDPIMYVAEDAIKALRLYDEYKDMPADRGGANGPRGLKYAEFKRLKDAVLEVVGRDV